MILLDANVLVYAFRRDSERHAEYAKWMENTLVQESAFGYSEFVLSAFIRIVTHPRIFTKPSAPREAFLFADTLKTYSNAIRLLPQENHWNIFRKFCFEVGGKGNLVPDAYLAALAVESGSTFVTCDKDFARFKGLKWRHPLDA